MASSSPSNQLFDPFRRLYVKATPEERVRQQWLIYLTESLGYPASLIAIEKSLKEISSHKKVPLRRADILCFASTGKPLLLIECKAVPLTAAMERQLRGYNYYVQAPYMALVNGNKGLFSTAGGLFQEGVKAFAALSLEGDEVC